MKKVWDLEDKERLAELVNKGMIMEILLETSKNCNNCSNCLSYKRGYDKFSCYICKYYGIDVWQKLDVSRLGSVCGHWKGSIKKHRKAADKVNGSACEKNTKECLIPTMSEECTSGYAELQQEDIVLLNSITDDSNLGGEEITQEVLDKPQAELDALQADTADPVVDTVEEGKKEVRSLAEVKAQLVKSHPDIIL